MSALSTPTEQPEAASSSARLPALDILRGLAILGTLLTNIWIFSAPVTTDEDIKQVGPQWLSSAISTALELGTDGKYIGLLTIMFGIGLEIQRQSAIKRGESFTGTYPWRAGLLIVEGALNYLFIFQFDVLMGYGLTGLVVCFVLASSPRTQRIWLAIGVTAHLLAMLATTSLLPGNVGGPAQLMEPPDNELRFTEALARLDPATATQQQVDALASTHGVSSEVANEALAALRNPEAIDTASYWGMVHDRATGFLSGRAEIPIMFTMGLGLFIVGAMLYRNGLFLPSGAKLRRWVMALSFGIGLPLDVVCRLMLSEHVGSFPRYVTSSLVSFGILALVAQFYAGGRRPGLIGRWLGYVGRLALTCYILQNLICSILFYDWGFGLARALPAQWQQLGTLAAWAGVSALLIGGSWWWLQRFPRGPFESVWHWAHGWLIRSVHEPLVRRRATIPRTDQSVTERDGAGPDGAVRRSPSGTQY